MKKILIVRFSSIGDIVLTTPIIRCIHQQIEKVEIHYLTRKSFAGILEANPYIDHLHTYEKSLSEVYPALKQEHFDMVIDLHKNIRSLRVKMNLQRPSSSFPKLNWEKWQLVNLKRKDIMPDIHIVDRYFEACQPLGVSNDEKGLDYFIPEGMDVNLQTLPEVFQKGYIGMVIGGAHATKVFPVEKCIELLAKVDHPIVLLGGPSDKEMGDQIQQALPQKTILNSCGQYKLHESASLVKQAELIISNDTGLMHIAAAFKKKIISLWGNTVPELGMYPYLPGMEDRFMIFENKDLKCRPCSKIGYKSCPKKHFNCMNMLDSEEIADAIEHLWQKK